MQGCEGSGRLSRGDKYLVLLHLLPQLFVSSTPQVATINFVFTGQTQDIEVHENTGKDTTNYK
jgi:hypothetical protein